MQGRSETEDEEQGDEKGDWYICRSRRKKQKRQSVEEFDVTVILRWQYD